MIHAATVANAATLTQPAAASPSVPIHARPRDAAGWFGADATRSTLRISGDLSAAARGLSVEQHAAAVLAHLRDDPDVL